MLKKIGSLIVLLLSLALLVYSASRSLDFIALTLPADQQILAWFGLAALDGGLIAWVMAFLWGSQGWQRPVAGLMVLVDFVGVCAMFTLDTLYQSGQAGLVVALSKDDIQAVVLALSAIIAANIGATVAHLLVEPDKLRKMAEEEALDKIGDAVLKQISQNADGLAAELSPKIAADWSERVRANLTSSAGMRVYASTVQALPAETVTVIPNEKKPREKSTVASSAEK